MIFPQWAKTYPVHAGMTKLLLEGAQWIAGAELTKSLRAGAAERQAAVPTPVVMVDCGSTKPATSLAQ